MELGKDAEIEWLRSFAKEIYKKLNVDIINEEYLSREGFHPAQWLSSAENEMRSNRIRVWNECVSKWRDERDAITKRFLIGSFDWINK